MRIQLHIIFVIRRDDEYLGGKLQVAPRHHPVRPPELGGGDSVPEANTLEGVGGEDLVVSHPRGRRRGKASVFVDGGGGCRLVDDDGNGRGQ